MSADDDLHKRVAALRAEHDQLRVEHNQLRVRVDHHSQRIDQLDELVRDMRWVKHSVGEILDLVRHIVETE